jgi:hypothetical protein
MPSTQAERAGHPAQCWHRRTAIRERARRLLVDVDWLRLAETLPVRKLPPVELRWRMQWHETALRASDCCRRLSIR